MIVAIAFGQPGDHVFERPFGKNGDAVIGLLPVYGAVVAQALECLLGECSVLDLDLLKADDFGSGFPEPRGHRVQPRLDGIDVPGGDFHLFADESRSALFLPPLLRGECPPKAGEEGGGIVTVTSTLSASLRSAPPP